SSELSVFTRLLMFPFATSNVSPGRSASARQRNQTSKPAVNVPAARSNSPMRSTKSPTVTSSAPANEEASSTGLPSPNATVPTKPRTGVSAATRASSSDCRQNRPATRYKSTSPRPHAKRRRFAMAWSEQAADHRHVEVHLTQSSSSLSPPSSSSSSSPSSSS